MDSPSKNPGRRRGLTPAGKGHLQRSAGAWAYVQFGGSKARPQKRTVSVFVVDKRSRKIVKPAKDMVLRQLSSLGVKAQAIIAGTSYAFWDISVPIVEEAVALTKKPFENKEYFFLTEYMGRRRTTVSIYEVPSFLRDANLAAYILQFGDIVSATHDGMRGEWRFDIMLDVKTYSVPNWLEVEGRRLPVIVSGRKPACWHCCEISHLSAVCPWKKAPKMPDQKLGTLPPVVSNTEKEAPVVSPTPAAIKNSTPPSSPTVNTEESGAEWLTVGKGGRKFQPADPHSRKLTQVGTNSPPPHKQSPTSVALLQQKHMPKRHLPPNLNTHPRPHLNSSLLPRSDLLAQAGRNLKNSLTSKSGWTRSANRLHDQSPLIPPLHLQNSRVSLDHHPRHLKDPCHHHWCPF